MEPNTDQVAPEEAADRHAAAVYDYYGTTVLAADVGAAADATVDVVDGTAVVVADDGQYEFDLPAGDAEAFIRNGVLTVEVQG